MNTLETEKLNSRPYQKTAIRNLSSFVKDLIRLNLEREDGAIFQSASLIEMATGSGKTFTIGKYLEHVIRLRNKYNRLFQKNLFQNLNIVVLTNRIDGLEQFRDDLIHGRTGEKTKPSILSGEVLSHIRSQTFHSQADNLEHLQYTDTDEVEGITEGLGDNIYFSTYQTASLKSLVTRLPYIDIILIDEAHNVGGENEFRNLVNNLSNRGRDGKTPHIIPITATPSNVTTELFGEPIFQYNLAEYLASSYSPRVEYKLITSMIANPEDISLLNADIERAKNITDIPEKKGVIREIKAQFDAMMAVYPDTENLVQDTLRRIENDSVEGTIGPTIIFVSSIREADEITKHLNGKAGKNIALAYHSEIKTNNALTRLANREDSIKFVVAVDMLNESIDLPTVENIVFWRGTDTARIYLQQFGRGLRGDGVVKYYDYVGGMKNFAWINRIYQEYTIHRSGYATPSHTSGEVEQNPLLSNDTKFHITSGSCNTTTHAIDMSSIGFVISKLSEDIIELTKEDVKNYFRENDTLEEWKKKTAKERRDIKVHGYGLVKIATIFGVEGDPTNTRELWYSLLGRIFKTHIEASELTKDEITEYFRNYGTLEHWISMETKSRLAIKIHGFGHKKIAGIICGDDNAIKNKAKWLKFLGIIFGTVIESELTKDEIIQHFRDSYTFDELIHKPQSFRRYFKIRNYGLAHIGAIFNITKEPIGYNDGWYELLACIFSQETPIPKLDTELILEYFKREPIEKWKGLTKRERQDIKINNQGLVKIASILGIQGDPIGYSSIWREMIECIFGVELEKIPNSAEIVNYFRIHGTYEEWKNKTASERRDIKVHGYGLIKIARMFSINGKPNIHTQVWHQLIDAIFSEEVQQ